MKNKKVQKVHEKKFVKVIFMNGSRKLNMKAEVLEDDKYRLIDGSILEKDEILEITKI